MNHEIRTLLEQVQTGGLTVDEAMLALKMEPYEDLGFAKIDHHRKIRNGVGEVIYGAGKTAEQIITIASHMVAAGQERILITRLDETKAEAIRKQAGFADAFYDATAQLMVVGGMPPHSGNGTIVVATGGTSDLPVAEEAALTAEFLGNQVVRLYDVGVAGLHRTLSHLPEIMEAEVVIAIAGMEGALASVLGGLAECPVIAVPTSVGYGASFGGISALLSMLNSCASGVSVVNIDNGFGAGYQASLINHAGKK
ncbi:MAG: nickel pincer cofactor biosynthesis protein LarB [Lachnospiraceae bacterium]|nr:nickel pincer cofactor biosynthesis protein LarB [Lachnospiraceae bacterium]